MEPIGRWVLEAACREAAAWQRLLPGAWSISVNVSARQLSGPDFPAHVTATLAATGLDPSRLELELTESAALADPQLVRGMQRELSALGVRFAVDDFGTGYASLTQLRQMQAGCLKVDRSFVAAIAADREARAIVRSILTLATDLGLEVIAEGIETTSQHQELEALGCGTGQGYHFARPMAAPDIAAFIGRCRASVMALPPSCADGNIPLGEKAFP